MVAGALGLEMDGEGVDLNALEVDLGALGADLRALARGWKRLGMVLVVLEVDLVPGY